MLCPLRKLCWLLLHLPGCTEASLLYRLRQKLQLLLRLKGPGEGCLQLRPLPPQLVSGTRSGAFYVGELNLDVPVVVSGCYMWTVRLCGAVVLVVDVVAGLRSCPHVHGLCCMISSAQRKTSLYSPCQIW